MADNLLTRFTERFFPTSTNPPAEVEKDSRVVIYGGSLLPQTSIKDVIGAPHDTDHALLYALYTLHVDVNACVNKWASGVSSAGWRITTMDPDAKPGPEAKRLIDETATWLRNPNPHKPFYLLLYELIQNLAICGDGFWSITRDPKTDPVLEIWPAHPITIRVTATQLGEVTGYNQIIQGKVAATFEPEEMLHPRLPNPTNDLYGEPPLASALEDLGLDLQAIRANRAMFENGLAPSLFIKLKDWVTKPEQAKQAEERLKAQHTGAANRHKLIISNAVEELKPYGQTLKDMEFIALRGLTTTKTCTAYRIPELLLGHHNAGDYATSRVLRQEVYESTYKPLQDQLAEVFTEHLIHTISPDLRFAFNEPDLADPEERRKDFLAAYDRGLVSKNEVRVQGFSLDEVDQPEDEDDEETGTTETGEADDATAEESPTPTDDADEPEKSLEGRFLRSLHKSWHPSWTDREAVQAAYKAAIEDIRERRGDTLDALADALRPKLREYFASQEARLRDQLAATVRRVRKQSEDEAQARITALLSGFGPDDQALAILLQEELERSAREGFDEAKLQINFTIGFNAIQPAVADYLLNHAGRAARGINETTRTRLAKQLVEGLTAGEGIPELSARVSSVFDQATGYRSELIARTETAQAFEFANQEAMKRSGVVAQKMWLTARDERVDGDICRPLDGVKVALRESFPGGIEPGFAHPGCRCVSIGIVGPSV